MVAPAYAAVSESLKVSAVVLVQPGEWNWQAWIIHQGTAGRYIAYPLSHEGSSSANLVGSYGPTLSISPDDRHLLEDQKTGSGDNFAELFTLKDGKFRLQIDPESGKPLSDRLLPFFRRTTGLSGDFYHYWVSWLGWEPDGQSVELLMSGHDLGEEYCADGWRAHFNIVTGRFFLTRDERIYNRRAIRPVNHHP
ncbi:MAG: hypothetical protein JWO82_3399 [Akkermansiaceae bacterium]|nr:hypothetical protein [Akkermansiaceae bacterium]